MNLLIIIERKNQPKNRNMNRSLSTYLIWLTLSLMACTPKKKPVETQKEQELSEILLTKAPPSVQFEDASLKLVASNIEKDSVGYNANFDFSVENYDLAVQTEDAPQRGIANSPKGQHIHFILNNGPYSAHYEPNISKSLNEGKYVLLAFLSRSYHESVKGNDAFYIDTVTMGNPQIKDSIDLAAQHIFYSRPKGTYTGDDTKRVMLDFFLLNTSLSENGNKVKATINDKEFMITEWAPYYIENAPIGDLKVRLELIDDKGNVIPGPFNSVERTTILAE